MEASKGNTTNILAGSPLKQEHVRIPVLLSRSPLLAFSAILSKTSHVLRSLFFFFLAFPVLSVFLKTPQTSLPNSIFSFSLGAKPSETSRLLPHASVFFFYKVSFRTSPKNPFSLPNVPSFPKTSQTSPSQHPHHTIFFPFSSRKITFNFGTPQHIQFPHFPRWAAALSLLHNSLPTKNPHGFKVGCNQPEK